MAGHCIDQSFSALARDISSKWPGWAPPALHDRLLLVATYIDDGQIDNTPAQRQLVNTISVLSSADGMQRVWKEIEQHAGPLEEADYPIKLAEEITRALIDKPICAGLTAEARRKKRKEAATAARKLRGILTLMNMENESVFPIIGTKAMSGALDFFLNGTGICTSPDSAAMAKELNILASVLMRNHPGVGSIGALLERLASRLESNDDRYWPPHRQADEQSRAKHLCVSIGRVMVEICGTPLYGTVSRLCKTFAPDHMLEKADVQKVLKSAGVYTSNSAAAIGAR